MNWYQGGIVEAITKSKSKGAVFVVYIEGKDEKSAQITKLVNNEDVVAKLGSDQFVAIKLEADSVLHEQFKQFYQTTPVPSIYFLGKNGVPIEIVTDVQDPQSFCHTMDTILVKGGVVVKPAQASDSLIKSEQAFGSTPANVVCENGVCTIKKDETNEEKAGSSSEKDEEKVERAKQIIEITRAQKQKEEEQKERQREIERRKMGQNVQQLKRWQDDQEMKQVLEERERERREGQAARDRVLAQIAQDKAERASKFQSPQQGTQGLPAPSVSQPQASPRAVNTHTARIQFRLPDGSARTNDFSSSETLEAVHAYIRNSLNLPFSNYTLSTTFPRREFTNEDKNRTLTELELVPTSVILILPLNRGAVSTNPSGGFADMVWYILTPIFSVLGFLKTFIFGSAPPTNDSRNSAPPNNPESSGNKRTADKTNEPPRVVIKKRAGGETTVIKRQGNIHRLSNKTDSDDENNTWNGNSTQQM